MASTEHDHELGVDLYRTREHFRNIGDSSPVRPSPLREVSMHDDLGSTEDMRPTDDGGVHDTRAVSGGSDSSKENIPQITDIKLTMEPLSLFDEPDSNSSYSLDDDYDADDDVSSSRDEAELNGLSSDMESASLPFDGEHLDKTEADYSSADEAENTAMEDSNDYPYPGDKAESESLRRWPLQPIRIVDSNRSTGDIPAYPTSSQDGPFPNYFSP